MAYKPIPKSGHDAGLGRAATWKASIQRNAAALFSRRSADLQSYVYSAPATDPSRGRGVAQQQVSHCLLTHLHTPHMPSHSDLWTVIAKASCCVHGPFYVAP